MNKINNKRFIFSLYALVSLTAVVISLDYAAKDYLMGLGIICGLYGMLQSTTDIVKRVNGGNE